MRRGSEEREGGGSEQGEERNGMERGIPFHDVAYSGVSFLKLFNDYRSMFHFGKYI